MSSLGLTLRLINKNSIIQRVLRNPCHQNFTRRDLHCSKIMSASTGPIQTTITKKLSDSLQPAHLQVINESHMHNVPKGSETHFKVVVVSDQFDKQALIKRHRIVNDILQEELKGPVHALSIQAKTPQQWEENAAVSKSPQCLGGMKTEAEQKSKSK